MSGTGTAENNDDDRCAKKLPSQIVFPSLLMQKREYLLLILKDQRQTFLILLDDVLVLLDRLLIIDDGFLIIQNVLLIIKYMLLVGKNFLLCHARSLTGGVWLVNSMFLLWIYARLCFLSNSASGQTASAGEIPR